MKRLLVLGVSLLLGLVALRLWWGWDAKRRLQAEIDKCIAAGEPIYPEDFDPPPVPDDQNAAKALLDAEKAITLTPEETELINTRHAGSGDDIADRLYVVRSIVESNARVLELVRKARGLPEVDWGVRFRTPAFNVFSVFSLSGQRSLSKLLDVVAGYHHATGNDAAAIETMRDALAQGRAVDSFPTVLSHLVAIATDALVVRRIETLAPFLAVRPEPPTGYSPEYFPTRAQVMSLIADLLNEEPIHNAHVRAMLGERMVLLDMEQLAVRTDVSLGTLMVGGGLHHHLYSNVWTHIHSRR